MRFHKIIFTVETEIPTLRTNKQNMEFRCE